MKILQRYVLREVISPMFLSLITLALVLVVVLIFSRFEEIAAVVSTSMLLRLTLYLLPMLLSAAIPMSVLIGVLLGVGRLTVDSEIKAFRTHGVSLYSVFIPVIALGAAATAFVFYNAMFFAPISMNQSYKLLDELKLQIFNSLEAGRFEDRLSTDDYEVILYFSDKDSRTGLLKKVYLWFEGGAPGGSSDRDLVAEVVEEGEDGRLIQTSPLAIPLPQADIGSLPAYTIEAWVRSTTRNLRMTALGFSSQDSTSSEVFCGVGIGGEVIFTHRSPLQEVQLSASASDVLDGNWHHIACVREAGDQWRLYVDGRLVDSREQAMDDIALTRGQLGTMPREASFFDWIGSIGWGRVSARALGGEEIEAIHQAGPRQMPLADESTLWAGAASPAGSQRGSNEARATARTLFLAPEGQLVIDQEAQSVTLNLMDGSIHFMRGHDDDLYSTIQFGRMMETLHLGTSGDYQNVLQALTLRQMRQLIAARQARMELSDEGNHLARIREMRAEIFQRASISLACFAFALIGLPLAIFIRPSGKSVGISIAFVLIALYYMVVHFGVVLTREGAAMGPIVIFLPNVLLTILGVVMLHRSVHR